MFPNLQKPQIIYLVLLFGPCAHIQADIYAATTELEYLLLPHMKVITDLEAYVNVQEEKLLVLKSYLDLHMHHIKITKGSYFNNPLNTFILIKRLVSDLDYISVIVKHGAAHVPYLLLKQNDVTYPQEEDLIGAAQGVDRLQKMYKLNIKDLAEGNLNNLAYTTPMTAGDCFELSQALLLRKDINAGRTWMSEAKQKYSEENVFYPFTEIDILKYLNIGNNLTEDTITTEQLSAQTLDPNAAAEGRKQDSQESFILEEFDAQQDSKYTQTIRTKEEEKDFKNYEALCRGDLVVPPTVSNRLICRYIHENHAFLKIAPFKVEMMYLNPDILLFHGVLSDIEIDTIKQLSKPKLNRAKINDLKTGILHEAPSRISKVAWLLDRDSDVMFKIGRRITQMTGLMETQHEIQVVNYGIGGLYEPHLDFAKNEEKFAPMHARKLATILFYMSDVAQGGATVFPKLGVRLLPVKGTAAFWFNLHPSLEGNYATRHAACPVLEGDKWVFSKFFNTQDQIFIKRCDLEYQEEGFDIKTARPVPKTIS